MASKLQSITFPASTSAAARIATVAPIISHAIDDFNDGKFKMGTEAFDVELRRLLLEAGLLERRVYDVTKVGTHPDNREQEMAIPVDVQDLLMREDGFNPSKWAALACTIPPGPIGDSWRQMNVDLILESDNFLAPVRADELEIATARGSHGTCAIR